MRISIWQQFASNHSNHFTLVGQFPTPESAQAAAAELRAFLAELWEWHQSNPTWEEETDRNRWGDTPVELAFRKKHNLSNWPPEGVDWVWEGVEKADWLREIQVQHDLLVIQPEFDTWMGPPYALNDFMLMDNALTAFNSEHTYDEILLTINCANSDTNMARWLCDLANMFSIELPPILLPWAFYVDDAKYPLVKELRQYIFDLTRRLNKQIEFRKQFPNIYEAFRKAKRERTYRDKSNIRKQLGELETEFLKADDAANEDWYSKLQLLQSDAQVFGTFESGFVLTGNRFALRVEVRRNVLQILNAIIAWLTELGCTDIKYTFSQIER